MLTFLWTREDPPLTLNLSKIDIIAIWAISMKILVKGNVGEMDLLFLVLFLVLDFSNNTPLDGSFSLHVQVQGQGCGGRGKGVGEGGDKGIKF